MNRLTKLAVVLLGLWLLALAAERTFSAQEPVPTKKEASDARALRPVAPEGLREDFHILRQALEEGHPGVYRYTPKAVLDRRFDEAEKTLDRPMTVYEFYRIVAPVVATVKCGHTQVRVAPDLNKSKLRLPFMVRVLDGKVYVLRDLSSKEGTLAGQQIRAVNGVNAATIVQTMLAAASGDGDVQTSRLRHIGGENFATGLIDLLGLESPYTVLMLDPKGDREHTVRLNGIVGSKLEEMKRVHFPQDLRPKESATLTFFDDGKIADLKVNRFGGTANNKSLHVFFQESFSAIDKRKSRALILDVRDNGGGADDLGKLLLSFLINERFQYYDDLVLNGLDFSFRKYTPLRQAFPAKMVERRPDGKYHTVKHPNWGMQEPSKPTFAGKVFILINGNSFSTTSEFLSHAHARKRATFIGEESGGGYYGNTSGPAYFLTLPNTKLQALVPLMTYYMAVRGYKAASHGVVPDYPVTYSIDELLAGTDKELALALELARKL